MHRKNKQHNVTPMGGLQEMQTALFLCPKQGGFILTDIKKELLQAKHRLEEAQARDRVKERNARTHRLIQIGAIFVKACPELAYMDLKELEKKLCEAMEKE